MAGLNYMIQYAQCDEQELFKICLEFWKFFTENLYEKIRNNPNQMMNMRTYPDILASLRIILMDRMVKPQEVLINIDEEGEIIDDEEEDHEKVDLYDTMRSVIIYATNSDTNAMNKALNQRLEQIVRHEKTNFPYELLSKLCWCLGSISGCMNESEENSFIVQVIKELLNLTEKTSGKNNKAQVASNIMYVVSRFPRFLCGHWAFLKTVIKKLNEFMHEKHPGVQDMASETFLTISELTKHMFV